MGPAALPHHTLHRLRSHSVFRYGLASLLPRSTAIVTALVMTPLALDRLGAVQYGYWVLATQIPNLIVSPDLGLGQGIINEVSEVQRREGTIASYHRRLLGLTKLLFAIAACWMVLGTGAITVYILAQAQADGPAWSLLTALVLGLACFTSGVPASVWARTQLAQETGHVSVLWEGAGKIITLASCILVLLFTHSLLLLVIAYLLPSSMTLWLNAFFYVRVQFPKTSYVTWPGLGEAFTSNRHVFHIGKYFLIMNICYVLGVALDPYLVNTLLSTRDVTYLNVTRRPYEMLPLVVALYSTALWPVFARLHREQALDKLRRLAFGIALIGILFVIGASTLIIIFRASIYNFLGRGIVHPSLSDLLWVTLHISAMTGVLVLTSYLSAASVIREQAVVMVIGAMLALATKVFVLHHWGIHAFIASAALSYTIPVALPLSLLAMWHLLPGSSRRQGSDLKQAL